MNISKEPFAPPLIRPSGTLLGRCTSLFARWQPSPSGRIRTNLRVQRSTAVSCRGSGSRKLAGGHALAGRTCSQIRPPEGNATNIVPRQPARGNAERPRLSALARACPAPAAFVRCVPGVGFASTFDLRTRDPRLTSYCRCRGNAPRSSLALKLVRMPSGRGQGEGSDGTFTLAVIGTEARNADSQLPRRRVRAA